MTVLFAFVSRQHDACMLAGDDLESHRNVKVEKVMLFWQRYAVAVYGLDVALLGAQYSAYTQDAEKVHFSGDQPIVPARDVAELCAQAARYIPRLAAMFRKNMSHKVQAGGLTRADYNKWLATKGGLVIVDYQLGTLHHATPKGPVLNSSPVTFDIEQLDPEVIHRFSINQPQVVATVTAEIVGDPRQWCQGAILDAKDECAKHGITGTIGNIGATFVKRAGSTEFWSAYSDVDDYMTATGTP